MCLLVSAQPATAQSRVTGEVRGVRPALDFPSSVKVVPARGTAYAVGVVLNGLPGNWKGAVSYGYLWQRCASPTAANCTTIPGQTALTYMLTAPDAGSSVRFMVTATNSSGSTTAFGNSQVIVAGALLPPSVTRSFMLLKSDGEPPSARDEYFVVGRDVNARASWSDAFSVTRAWQRCALSGSGSCVPIPGQTTQQYVMTAADVGFGVRLEETASNPAGSTTAVSNISPMIRSGTLPKPVLNGMGPSMRPANTPQADYYRVGTSLGTTDGTWAQPAPTFAYGWQRCPATSDACVAIGGQTTDRYLLVLADVGSRIRAAVIATNSAGATVATSNMSEVIRAAAGYPPQLAGGAQEIRLTVVSGPGDRVGSVLRGTNGPWANSPTIVTIGWLRCITRKIESCQPIPGATTVERTVDASDINFVLMLKVTASNAAGSSTVLSNNNPQILPGVPVAAFDGKPQWSDKTLSIGAPRGYGTGATLVASYGTWKGASTSVTSVWQSCDASGAACVAIAGQTQRTFTIIAEYAGRTLRYQETATNAAGSTTLTSLPTPVIVP